MTHHKISLIVQPGDSFFPIVKAIDRAERSINITVFRLDDPIIKDALLAAHHRGVRVRALVATSARGWEEQNRRMLKNAKKAGISVREPAGDSKKSRFHYKIMTVDGGLSLVLTFNPTRENLHYTRDFGIVLHDDRVASELNRLFDADWDDVGFEPDPQSPLLVSPYNSRRKMLDLLGSAERSIHISDAKVEDREVIDLLEAKARGGVDVRILGDEGRRPAAKKGVSFHPITRFKLHAKCVIVDGARASIGSMNLRTESFDRRREVAIQVDDAEVVKRLEAVFASDWEHKAPTSSSAATMVAGLAPAPTREFEAMPTEGFVLISRTDALLRHVLRRGMTTVGRSEENDVVLENALASRRHARVEIDDEGCTLTDLGSPNGTYVNGERVTGSIALEPGDVVAFAGNEEYRFLEV